MCVNPNLFPLCQNTPSLASTASSWGFLSSHGSSSMSPFSLLWPSYNSHMHGNKKKLCAAPHTWSGTSPSQQSVLKSAVGFSVRSTNIFISRLRELSLQLALDKVQQTALFSHSNPHNHTYKRKRRL